MVVSYVPSNLTVSQWQIFVGTSVTRKQGRPVRVKHDA